MCIYTDNVCNQEVFQISFRQFVWEAKYEKCVHSWWKECGIKYCVLEKHTALPVIQFSQSDISIYASLVVYILWYRIWGAHSGEGS
jgi:predicted lipid carrier protein YhbT